MSRIERNHGMRHTFAALAVALGAIFAATTADARSIESVSRRVTEGKMFLDVTFDAGSEGDNHALYIARRAISRLHKNGITVQAFTWTEGANKDVLRQIWKLGFDNFATDDPLVLFELRPEFDSRKAAKRSGK